MAKKKLTLAGIEHMSSIERSGTLDRIAKSRADRLKKIREVYLNNVPIIKLSKLYHYKQGTLGRAEKGYTCLKLQEAKWFCLVWFKEFKLYVNINWLLNGVGPEPSFVDMNHFNIKSYMTECLKEKKKDLDMERNESVTTYMLTELLTQMKENTLITYVRDHNMEPAFNKSDIVGGVCLKAEDLHLADQKICIVEVQDNIFVVRFFHFLEEQGVYILTSINNIEQPIVLNQITKLAIVSFRYSPMLHLHNKSESMDNEETIEADIF